MLTRIVVLEVDALHREYASPAHGGSSRSFCREDDGSIAYRHPRSLRHGDCLRGREWLGRAA
ncbi:unnamed protein product [Ascophyllum nodosum]